MGVLFFSDPTFKQNEEGGLTAPSSTSKSPPSPSAPATGSTDPPGVHVSNGHCDDKGSAKIVKRDDHKMDAHADFTRSLSSNGSAARRQ